MLVHHRKLAFWGRICNLICGENTNYLAKYALAAQEAQLHLSMWPAIWPTRMGSEGKANYGNVAANRVWAAAHLTLPYVTPESAMNSSLRIV